MKVKHFNVTIVNRNLQKRLASRRTYRQYMKAKDFNVNIVNKNSHEKVILRDTSSQYMKEQLHEVDFEE